MKMGQNGDSKDASHDRMTTKIKYYKSLPYSKEKQNLEIEMCRRDPWYWLSNWVLTLDEHDRKNPVKRFPCKPYQKHICEVWEREPLLLIPKSRQVMISWEIVALYLWDTQFFRGRRNFFQSKKEDDAAALVERAKIIFENQPEWMKPKADFSYGRISFPDLQSEIRGIPQGGDQLRSYTASGIFCDEMAFQEKAEEAYKAARPTITGGGRFTGVSSAAPGFFEVLVNDRLKMAD